MDGTPYTTPEIPEFIRVIIRLLRCIGVPCDLLGKSGQQVEAILSHPAAAGRGATARK
ncbi:hypothetical protein KKC74_12155 [bacterium]|nr:hypothetical protein [bacterium]